MSDSKLFPNLAFQQTVRNNIGKNHIPIMQRADTVGDGSGNYNMNVNGSITPVNFFIKPQANTVLYIARAIFILVDAGSFDSGGWGNNGGVPLQNGIDIVLHQNGYDFAIDNKLKRHSDVAALCYDVSKYSWGSGDEWLTARLTFTKFHGFIELKENDYIKIVINDDLTYLKEQHITFEGFAVVK